MASLEFHLGEVSSKIFQLHGIATTSALFGKQIFWQII